MDEIKKKWVIATCAGVRHEDGKEWWILGNHAGDVLGDILWLDDWKQYTFRPARLDSPYDELHFNEECQHEIGEILEEINKRPPSVGDGEGE